jgi:hypothetical protein
MSTTAATPDLSALRELVERDALTRLIVRLGRWLDAGAPGEDAAAVFAPDVSISTPGGRARGIEAVVAQARRNHDVPTQHFVTDLLIALDGDSATIGANLLVAFVREGSEPEVMGERYAFDAVRTADGWRLASVEAVPLWRRA